MARDLPGEGMNYDDAAGAVPPIETTPAGTVPTGVPPAEAPGIDATAVDPATVEATAVDAHATEAVPEHDAAAQEAPPEKSGVSLQTKLIFAVIGIAAVVGLYFWFRQVATRWWGNTVADWVAGSFSKGVWYGLLLGLLGTTIALVLFLIAVNQWMSRRLWLSVPLVVLGVAAVVPMILTLAVITGGSSGAHAGQMALDMRAPGFRGAMLVGLLLGLGLGVFLDFKLLKERRERAYPVDAKRIEKRQAKLAKQQKKVDG